jgi:hypothetical protein
MELISFLNKERRSFFMADNNHQKLKKIQNIKPEALRDDELCAVAGGQGGISGDNSPGTVWIDGTMFYIEESRNAISCPSFQTGFDPGGYQQKKLCQNCVWHHHAVERAGEAVAAAYTQKKQFLCLRPDRILP